MRPGDSAASERRNDENRLSRKAPRPGRAIHVLTLTPFFPSANNPVSGCFVKEPLDHVTQLGVVSSVVAVTPLHYPRPMPNPSASACWVRFPQIPGNLGLSSAGWFLYASSLRRVMQIHLERPIDVIHAHAALPCGHAAMRFSSRIRIPYVVTVHGLDVFNAYQGRGLAARWRKERSVEIYRNARTVLCVSAKVQQILREGVSEEVRTAVAYNSADTDLFSPAPAEEDPPCQELLAVGNLIPTKGHVLILRAAARLAPAFPQLRCQFIGEGPHRVRLESLAAELGIARQVTFAGRRSRMDVAEAMRRCSVFVLPSRSEGLGCVYLEAMACAKPVVACHGQGIEEVIEQGRNGYLVPGDSLDTLVQTLATLLQSRDLSRTIGSCARQTILSRFTLAHQAQSLLHIYREAIEHN